MNEIENVNQQYNILIVEDDLLNQRMISKILKSENYNVTVTHDGRQVLNEIKNQHFNLILSDINMPNFDGFQLMEYISKNKINVPVFFMSGHSSGEIGNKVLEMGAASYFSKPVNRELLLLQIKKVLNP